MMEQKNMSGTTVYALMYVDFDGFAEHTTIGTKNAIVVYSDLKAAQLEVLDVTEEHIAEFKEGSRGYDEIDFKDYDVVEMKIVDGRLDYEGRVGIEDDLRLFFIEGGQQC